MQGSGAKKLLELICKTLNCGEKRLIFILIIEIYLIEI